MSYVYSGIRAYPRPRLRMFCYWFGTYRKAI